ncbi:fumarylacetoacetate hydrolase family protein [Hippea jasoniae]|uniref:fumarylacetoacetate hydrolase family protein n=1 Tax=Hippea jasoniae TaxID=944479 RepID=UPI00054F0364|nr:fumarylacetoacetate hydrolase family protein [Hippea jasoniae]
MKAVVFDKKEVIPSKVVCIARNYVAHIEELKNEMPDQMALFIKPNSAICDELILPELGECHYEGEITFIIENGGFAGVGFGLDLTLRDIQGQLKEKGLPWEKAKAFDCAAVFSEFVRFDGDINRLGIELYINGVLKQQGDVSLMINKPDAILDEAKRYFTFYDYDLLMSGTPKGVGSFEKNDEFLGRILYDGEVIVEKRWVVK